MRKLFLSVTGVFIACTLNKLHSQNHGFGTNNPQARVHVAGNFLVSPTYERANGQPTAAQTKTMINGGTITFTASDSIGRIFDPSGPRSPIFYDPYAPNANGSVAISAGSDFPGVNPDGAIEITIEWLQLGDGDSLIFGLFTGGPGVDTVRIGSGFTTPAKLYFQSSFVRFDFTTNGDLSVGEGFSILFRRLYKKPQTVPDAGYGNQLYFDVNKNYFRAGNFKRTVDYAALSTYSASFGFETRAGNYAFAAGSDSKADGVYSFATGRSNIASGIGSAALGFLNHSDGGQSFAIGRENSASGTNTLATGFRTLASGTESATFGRGTLALSYASISMGQYNFTTPTSGTTWVPTDPAFIVGNGTSDINRSNILEFYKNGNHLIWGSYFSFSDQRLKTSEEPLKNSFQRLSQLTGYNYRWKSKDVDPELQTGFMSQQVQEVFPELVRTNQKGDMAVNYTGLIPHLVEALKELKTEVEDLKNQLQTQTNIIVYLPVEGKESIQAFPNPSAGLMNVQLHSTVEGKGVLKLMNNGGHVLRQMGITIVKGINNFQLSLVDLPAGQYELVVNLSGNQQKTVKIVKQ